MAAKTWASLSVCVSIITLLTTAKVSGSDLPSVYQRIYKEIDSINACFRLLNATHQIGCSATPSNVSGVLWYVQSKENITNLLDNHPHSPYIVILEPHLFTRENVIQLKESGHVNGVIMNYNMSGVIPQELSRFSPAETCPNSGFNKDCTNKWNVNGSQLAYEDFDKFAIFTITSEDPYNELMQCFKDHNEGLDGSLNDYPLCAAELQADMSAVGSTVECYQRSKIATNLGALECQPLGDTNVWATLFEVKENTEIIIVATKLDSSALIPDLSFGANNELSGIVTQLAVAETLGKLKQNGELTGLEKQIMFVFFQGESFDYIGSSRMVYDMIKGDFLDNPLLNITNISSILELSQVGIPSSQTTPTTYYLHSVNNEGSDLYSTLKNSGTDNVVFEDSSVSELPPSSAQMFLRERNSIPTVIITDYDKQFNNKFFGSRYDTIDNLLGADESGLSLTSPLVTRLTDLSTSISQTLLNISGASTPPPSADPETVRDLLECFLISMNCSLLRKVLSPTWVDALVDQPVSRYVTVQSVTNAETQFAYNLLAYFTGIQNTTFTTCDQCDNANTDSDQSVYTTMSGLYHTSDNDSCMCYMSYIHRPDALSPAFVIKDYDSTKYSTWTESNWNSIGMRIYLVTYTLLEAAIFIGALTISTISLFVVWQCSRKSKLIFAMSANTIGAVGSEHTPL